VRVGAGAGATPLLRSYRDGYAALVAPAPSPIHTNRGPRQVPDTVSARTRLCPASVLHWTKVSTRFSPNLYLFRT